MTIPAMAGFQALSQQAAQLLSHHKRGGHSLADVDATSAGATSAPNKTGKIGSKVDISA
jgi:hypothetical protein